MTIPGTPIGDVIISARNKGVEVTQSYEDGTVFSYHGEILAVRPCGSPPVFTRRHLKQISRKLGIEIP